MNNKTFLILGGYGGVGRSLARLLLQETDIRLVLAGQTIEKANENYSAFSPDLPGCVATGATREEAEKNRHEAIEMHVRGLLEDNLPIPESHSFAEYVAVQ